MTASATPARPLSPTRKRGLMCSSLARRAKWPSSRCGRTILSFNDRKNKEPSHGSATHTARAAAVRYGAIAHQEWGGKEEGARPAADAHGRVDQKGPAALYADHHELDQRPTRQANDAHHPGRRRPPARRAEGVIPQR